MIIRITAPHFCAGIMKDSEGNKWSAPIIKYMKDWKLAEIKAYCKKKNWKLEVIR